MKKQKRIVVYISEEDYKSLKEKLTSSGHTVSGWFRYITRLFLEGKL